jgi:phage gp36-like protein
MAYCVAADVADVLNPLGQNPSPGSAAMLPTNVITDLIDEASTFINGWLADRYQVPFTDGQVPDLVVKMTRVIAAFYATTAAAGNQEIPAQHPMTLRYNNAVATCRALAAGVMTLALPATDSGNPNINTTISAPPVFNVDCAPCFTPSDFQLTPTPYGPDGTWGGWQGTPL